MVAAMPRPCLHCVYCDQAVIEDVKKVTRTDLRRLLYHLRGCPAALAASAPALPVFRQAELLNHFRREESCAC
jgi:hypothetical protein